MKKFSLSLVLVISLQAAPMPAQAGNGMTDMLSTMMQLFLWMMSSGNGMSGFNSSGMNPYSMNSMSPYGMSSYGMNPYNFGGSGGQGHPFQRWPTAGYSGGGSPYSPYGYGGQAPYSGPYNNSYYNRGHYNGYGYNRPAYPIQGKASSLVIQPIIVSPGQDADGRAPKIEYLPAHSVEPVAKVAPANSVSYDKVLAPPVNNYNAWDYDNPMLGSWQGVNGEFLELGTTRFRLRSQNSDMQGTYQINNGIMKAEIFNRTEPAYMQYRMAEGQLLFRSEDGQMMLFRRLD